MSVRESVKKFRGEIKNVLSREEHHSKNGLNVNLLSAFQDHIIFGHSRCQFHQHFMSSFYARRSQNCKNIQLCHQYLFTLLGSTSVKAARRMLMKLSPAHGGERKRGERGERM